MGCTGSKSSGAPKDTTVKIVVLGTGAVGKSCFTIRFIQDKWIDQYDPTIEDNFRKQIEMDGSTVVFDVLDTAGQEEWKAMRDNWISGGHGFILMYAVDSETSLDLIPGFYEHVIRVKDSPSTPMILIGHKSDLGPEQRQVSREKGQAMADRLGIRFMEASAKRHYNVDEAFFDIARQIRNRR
eukprot:TRINITY_DN557_c0_g1_i2.p1 TRINITY_DN557_c0_g1~~TRINITY_DN557_c0_g1_i2.p1  ORF type:complete len:183 (+),score=45.17 TRINITY_DN557_c0_g1_i2:103-651(+)